MSQVKYIFGTSNVKLRYRTESSNTADAQTLRQFIKRTRQLDGEGNGALNLMMGHLPAYLKQ